MPHPEMESSLLELMGLRNIFGIHSQCNVTQSISFVLKFPSALPTYSSHLVKTLTATDLFMFSVVWTFLE